MNNKNTGDIIDTLFTIVEERKKSKEAKLKYDFERGSLSAIHIINRIMPDLKKFFNSGSPEVNSFIHLMYAYLTSRSPLSGKFVIAK